MATSSTSASSVPSARSTVTAAASTRAVDECAVALGELAVHQEHEGRGGSEANDPDPPA